MWPTVLRAPQSFLPQSQLFCSSQQSYYSFCWTFDIVISTNQHRALFRKAAETWIRQGTCLSGCTEFLKAGGLTHSGPSQPLHLKPLPMPPSPFLPHLPCLHQSEPGKKGRPWVQNQVLLFIVCVTLGITDAVPEP